MKKMDKKDVVKMLLALTLTAIVILFIFGWLPLDNDSDKELEYTTIAQSENWQLEVAESGWSNLSYKGFVPDIEKTITITGIIVDKNGETEINKTIDKYTVADEFLEGHWLIDEELKIEKANLTIQWSDGEQTYEEKLSNVEI